MKKKKARKKSSKKKVPKASLKKAIDELHDAGKKLMSASLMRAHAHGKSKGLKHVSKHVVKLNKHFNNIKKLAREVK